MPQIYQGECLEPLQRGGLYIIQPQQGFRFGMDAVLLAHFACPKRGERVVDACTGAGVVGLLLLARQPECTVWGVEIQPQASQRAARSVAMNGLQDRMRILTGDISTAHRHLGNGFDRMTCNPPYEKADSGRQSKRRGDVTTRQITCTLEDVCRAARKLLRAGGKLDLVYPAEQVVELLNCTRQHGLEVKKMRMLHHSPLHRPSLVLVEAMLGGKPGCMCLPPLFVQDAQGNETPEYQQIYYAENGD